MTFIFKKLLFLNGRPGRKVARPGHSATGRPGHGRVLAGAAQNSTKNEFIDKSDRWNGLPLRWATVGHSGFLPQRQMR